MLRVGNFVPAISLEGFEEATDGRRGGGVYQKVTKAMSLLREKKLIYGISCCYTSANYESITDDDGLPPEPASLTGFPQIYIIGLDQYFLFFF